LGIILGWWGCAPYQFRGVCWHNAIAAAVVGSSGKDADGNWGKRKVRVVTFKHKYEPNRSHAQAQIFIDGKWRWLSLEHQPVAYTTAKHGWVDNKDWKVVRYWSLSEIADWLKKHDKECQRGIDGRAVRRRR